MNRSDEQLKVYQPSAKRHKADDTTSSNVKFSYEDLHNYLFHKRNATANTPNVGIPVDGSTSINPTSPTSHPQSHEVPNPSDELPDIVRVCSSVVPGAGYGVQASQVIPEGAWIGPYKGRLIKPGDDWSTIDSSYLWEIFNDGKLLGYIDGGDKKNSSWMRFIRCARHKQEQNLYAFQYLNKIYYRAYKTIQPGQELLVWYDDIYTQYLGIPYEGIYDMASSKDPSKFGGHLVLVAQEEGFLTPPSSPSKSPSYDLFKPVSPPPLTTAAPAKEVSQLEYRQNSKEIIRDRLRRKQSGSFSQDTVRRGLSVSPFPLPLPPPLQSRAEFPNQRIQTNSTETNYVVTAQFSQPSPSSLLFPGFDSSSKTTQFQSRADDVVLGSLLVEKLHLSEDSTQVSPQNENHVNDSRQSSNVSASESSISPSSSSGHEVVSPTTTVVNEQPQSLQCGQCKTTFSQRSILQTHICTSLTTLPYQCGHCDERFSSPGQMTVHVAIHQDKKPFKCGYCSRSFTGATTLNNHVRMHSGEKAFDCYKCGKTFTKGLQLSRHQKIPGNCVPCS